MSSNNNNQSRNYQGRGGRGRGNNRNQNRGGRGSGRSSNRRNHNNQDNNNQSTRKSSLSLDQCIFDWGSVKHQDQFQKSLDGIILHIGTKYKDSGNITRSLERLRLVPIAKPAIPTSTGDAVTDEYAKLEWKAEYDNYIKEKKQLRDNLDTAYNLIWRQCTESMKAKLKTLTNYECIKDENNVIDLIKEIKVTTFKYEETRYPMEPIFNAYEKYYRMRQHDKEEVSDFYERYKTVVEAGEQYGCEFGQDEACMKHDDIYKALPVDQQAIEANIEAAQE